MKKILFILFACWSASLYADDWPREVSSSEGLVTMYQPQIEDYSGTSLKARAAVSIVPEGTAEPVFGALWVNCTVLTDRPSRTVRVEEMDVRRIKFPGGTDLDTARIADALEEAIPRMDLTFSLDFLLESISTAARNAKMPMALTQPPRRSSSGTIRPC